MNKILIAGFTVATAFAAVAMPTKTELNQARKPVEDATKADLMAYKAGQKTAKELAESHLALAAKAENQAEKYLYYQGAFKIYARSGEYSLAIDTIEAMKSDVKDVTPEVINELMGRNCAGWSWNRLHGSKWIERVLLTSRRYLTPFPNSTMGMRSIRRSSAWFFRGGPWKTRT